MSKLMSLLRYGVIGLTIWVMSAQLVVARPSYQEEPCVGDPDCYEPPPKTDSTTADSPVVKPVWEGFIDGRLNPDLAEYYSVWCLDGVVRVLRGVPTTALVDDIPIVEVSDLPEGGTLLRNSGLTVVRSADSITVYGNNGNLQSAGLKSFSLTECQERNGILEAAQPVETTDNGVQQTVLNLVGEDGQPEATPEPTAEPVFSPLRGLPPNNTPGNLLQLIIDFLEDICGVPMISTVIMFPVAWKLRGRRKQGEVL